ncbi:hypothetical protein LguiB_007488 [Lonicera macranthoides]
MSKAYDMVKWQFLENMMRKLGFDNMWINLVMMYVSSIKYVVRQEGPVVGQITFSRGLRQGDPIFPYFFFICAEGFSSILHDKYRRGLLYGCRVARTVPEASHTFFAYNRFLLFKATEE